MFCVQAVWFQVQGNVLNGKAHCVPATTSKEAGPVFPGAATLKSPSNSLQFPSTAGGKHPPDQQMEDNFHVSNLSKQLSSVFVNLPSTYLLAYKYILRCSCP